MLRNSRLAAIAAATLLAALPACTYRVDSFADSPDADPGDFECARALMPGEGAGPPGGLCTLRAAVMEASAAPIGFHRIELPAGTYELVLPLAAGGGALRIERGMVIHGAGPATTDIVQTASDSVLIVEDGDVEIGQVTIQGGNSQFGGGLRIRGGEVEVTDAVIRENFAFTGGGGLLVEEGATARVRRTAIEANDAQGAFGGGIFNQGELFVFDSSVTGNTSNRAGGIRNDGLLNLRNVTVSGNTVASLSEAGTGGIANDGFAFLNNVTVTGNVGVGTSPAAARGGGIETTSDGTTVVKNSIIAGNDGAGGPNDCSGAVTPDSRYNLLGDSAGCELPAVTTTWLLDVDPVLGPLALNGGPLTRSHALFTTSPGRDAGFPFTPGGPAADACEGGDQRGVPRPQGTGGCDMGAYELTFNTVAVVGFVIVDTDTEGDVRPLIDGDQLVLEELPANLSIRATVSFNPGSLRFGLDGEPAFQVENLPPYALAGDSPQGNYQAAPSAFTVGEHTLTATPFLTAGATGAAGIARTIRYTVVGEL